MMPNLNDYTRDQDKLLDYRPQPLQIKVKPNYAGFLRAMLKWLVKEVSHLCFTVHSRPVKTICGEV